VQGYEKRNGRFIVVARKTARLVDEWKAADWKPSPRTDAGGQCEFFYQPEGWGKAYRFLALRYEKKPEPGETDQPEQYQLFDTPEYTYRVFVTNMDGPLDAVVGFYRGRASAENLIKEANNDAGLAAHPSKRWTMNANWFQIVMLAYNLNCWLLLFQRQESENFYAAAARCKQRVTEQKGNSRQINPEEAANKEVRSARQPRRAPSICA